MPEPHDRADGIEAIAFQILLEKVIGLERAVQSLPPLLTKIIDHLEMQAKQPDVPIATYAQLYAQYVDAPEDEALADDAVLPAPPVAPGASGRGRRFWWWFLREGT